MMISELDLLFNAYRYQSGKQKQEIAEHLCISRATMSAWWKAGVGTWPWDQVVKAAHFLGIPIDVLRETLTYRKDNK